MVVLDLSNLCKTQAPSTNTETGGRETGGREQDQSLDDDGDTVRQLESEVLVEMIPNDVEDGVVGWNDENDDDDDDDMN